MRRVENSTGTGGEDTQGGRSGARVKGTGVKEEVMRMEEEPGRRGVKGSEGGRRGGWLRHLQPKGDGKRGRCRGSGGSGPGRGGPLTGGEGGAVTTGMGTPTG